MLELTWSSIFLVISVSFLKAEFSNMPFIDSNQFLFSFNGTSFSFTTKSVIFLWFFVQFSPSFILSQSIFSPPSFFPFISSQLFSLLFLTLLRLLSPSCLKLTLLGLLSPDCLKLTPSPVTIHSGLDLGFKMYVPLKSLAKSSL